ncbi:hypothetical protein [Nocardiopsis alkaliphila]|uniref:hypothetical protein n=1 Tax=Nocardiopsis alkaliphila TaxID=225762 RepID=UPI001267FCED|nr:hypothetical protein [Nocardiopsis alkaliphila]
MNVGTSAPPKPAQATGVLTERLDATPEPGRSGLLPMGSVLFGVAATTPGAGPRPARTFRGGGPHHPDSRPTA